MNLIPAQRLTLLRISESLATTARHELLVYAALQPVPVGYQNRLTRVAIVSGRGKRKKYYLDLAAADILLDGWSLPFQTDTEAGGIFAGNACFNLVGDPETIRGCLETQAARPLTDAARAKILIAPQPRTTCDDTGHFLLYPELETSHAVVNALKQPA